MTKLTFSIASIGYVLLLVLMTFLLQSTREWARQRFDADQAHQAWTEWRDETAGIENASDRPVQRRPAISTRPPTYVLLEEHFWVCWTAIALIGGVIYWTTAVLLVGAFRDQKRSAMARSSPEA